MNLRYSPFDCVGANAFIFCLPRHHSMFSMVTRGSLPREKESFPGLLIASRVSVHRSNKRDFLFFFFFIRQHSRAVQMFQNQKTRQRTWSENEDVKFVISLLMIFPWLAHSRNATIYFWNEKKVISHCDEFLQFHFSHPPVCYSEFVRIVESVVVERVQSRPSDKANVARCIDQAWKLSAFFSFPHPNMNDAFSIVNFTLTLRARSFFQFDYSYQ